MNESKYILEEILKHPAILNSIDSKILIVNKIHLIFIKEIFNLLHDNLKDNFNIKLQDNNWRINWSNWKASNYIIKHMLYFIDRSPRHIMLLFSMLTNLKNKGERLGDLANFLKTDPSRFNTKFDMIVSDNSEHYFLLKNNGVLIKSPQG